MIQPAYNYLVPTVVESSNRGERAAIGPSIGPCCFEVGAEVVAQFPEVDGAVSEGPRGRPHLDLWELNRRGLARAGVAPENVEAAGVCTRCNPEAFFSHRALGYPAGRFGAAIGLRDESARDDPVRERGVRNDLVRDAGEPVPDRFGAAGRDGRREDRSEGGRNNG